MSALNYKIVCVQCEAVFSEEQTITRCLDCGQALDIQFDMQALSERINRYNLRHTPISAMKYLDFYPLKNRSTIISLDEGNTPLVDAKKLGESLGLTKLYIKNEGANPTGVFKDRGSLVEISKAIELGAKGIVVASTGNMAASVSAYSAKAGIPCYVLVPEGTPLGKLSQSLAYGGKVLKIRGTYADCVRLSEEMATKYGYLLAGDYAFRGEGQKSIAYEIVEQLGWKVPDVVIAPVGCGTNLYGIAKGFFEWKELGLIDRVPRIIGTQPEKADTLYSAFYAGENEQRTIALPKSLCGAVNIGTPLDDMKLLQIIRKSEGDFEIIDDTTTLEAQKDMATIASVFTEPSGAIPVACLKKLLYQGKISKDELVVCVATGTGLKDPHSATVLFPNFPSIESNMTELDSFLDSGLLDMQSKRKDKAIVFSTRPSKEEIRSIAINKFSFDTQKNPDLFEILCSDVNEFFERRTEMKNSDFHIILEEVVSDFHSTELGILKIIDFSGTTNLTKKSTACVKIEFLGKQYEGCAEGTGPVDAAITAIENLLAQHTQFTIRLKSYSVSIPSGGVNAAVRVKMRFEDEQKNTARVVGVSSDIVVASLMAYQKGFLRLWRKQAK